MDYLKKSKLFYITILLICLLILWSQIKDIEILNRAFQVTFSTLLIPVIFSIFIYYLLKPIYLFLTSKLKKESLSLLVTFIIFFGLLTLLFRKFIPLLAAQLNILIDSLPQLINELDRLILSSDLFNTQDINQYLAVINHSFEDLINLAFVGLKNSTNFVFAIISNSFLVFSIMPIMVFYMLKNTNKPKQFKLIPEKYRALAIDYFNDSERVLSDYISGKALVCFYVFVGALISFTFAGLPGAFLFALIAGILDVVPYFGPWVGVFPAVLSGLISDNVNVWIIIIGIIIVQLGESYLVSPLVMSKEMKMHPLGIIIIMLITGQIFGLLGMIIILPVIAVLKVTVIYLYKLFLLNKNDNSKIRIIQENDSKNS